MMRKKIKNNYKKLFFLFFFYIFNSNLAVAVEANKIIISDSVSKRINQYLEKKIYSRVYDNKIYDISRMAFAISDDGSSSVLGYCREKRELCRNGSPYLFQINKRCEKISKTKCKIIMKDDFVFINKKKIKLNKENKKKIFLIEKKIINDENKQTDFEIENNKDYESDWN